MHAPNARTRSKPLLLGLLMAGLSAAPLSGRPADPPQTVGLEMENCELVVPGTPLTVRGECAGYEIAENPEDPGGRKIRLHVARVPATDRTTQPDPLLFFAGGPGQAASETWPLIARALRKVNEQRDILLIDQRGTGGSNALKCPQIELDEALALDWDELARTTRECLESLDGDPRFYTTTIAMHDIDAVREAMGYEKVNLFGVSYGTRAAQVYLRLYPDRVRTMILDSIVPQTLILGSEHAQKLDQAILRVLERCDEDPRCAEAFPESTARLTSLKRSLAESPVEVTVDHPTTGEPYNLTFNREVLASSLRFLTYSADTQAMLPLLIFEADTRQQLERLASQMLIAATALQQSISQGMELSVVCAEDAPHFPPAPPDNDYLLGNLLIKATNIQCGIWPRGPVPAGFHEPVVSDVPALLLSGELDPVTPPEYGDAVARHLSNSLHLVAPGQGHSISRRGCLGRLISEFIIAGSSDQLDAGCIDQLQSTPYFISLTGPSP